MGTTAAADLTATATEYALAPNWRWTRTLHLFGPDGKTRCGRPVVGWVTEATVQQVLGDRRPVCGRCQPDDATA